MKIPELIEFHSNCNTILCKSLKAAYPHEGCALLLGTKSSITPLNNKNIWQIKYIWPCNNIWNLFKVKLNEPKNQGKKILSKSNRFTIDPREQIAAQRWARGKDYQVLGSAHSHPEGGNKPSKVDLACHIGPGLIIIINKNGFPKAWWISNEKRFQQVAITNLSLS